MTDHNEVPEAARKAAWNAYVEAACDPDISTYDVVMASVFAAMPHVREAQIKHMVDRFLGWRLPANFSPDAGISFEPRYNVDNAHGWPEGRHEPSGTNLFDATQAREMVLHMLDGLPAGLQPPTEPTRAEDAPHVEPIKLDIAEAPGFSYRDNTDFKWLPVAIKGMTGVSDYVVMLPSGREHFIAKEDFEALAPMSTPHVEPGGEREKHLRLETMGENLARDMAEGRFPARSEPRMRPDIDSAWDAIMADPLLSEARRKLSANEIKQIIAYAESFVLRSSRDAVLEEAAKACEEQERAFLSPQYASNQPLGSLTERFACEECAKAIRAMKASQS